MQFRHGFPATEIIQRSGALSGPGHSNGQFFGKRLYFPGVALQRQGQPDRAVINFIKVLKLNPDAEFIYRDLCYAHVQLRQTDAAKYVIQQGLAVNRESFDFHFLLGSPFGQEMEYDRAIAACQKTLSIRSDYTEAHSKLGGLFLAQNRLDDAAACSRNALKLKPDYVSAVVDLGNILNVSRQLRRCYCLLPATIGMAPDLTDVRSALRYVPLSG